MMNLSPWMAGLAVGLILVGLLHGRSRYRRAYPPTWVCGLLAVGALVGMWMWLNAQFAGQVIQFHLP